MPYGVIHEGLQDHAGNFDIFLVNLLGHCDVISDSTFESIRLQLNVSVEHMEAPLKTEQWTLWSWDVWILNVGGLDGQLIWQKTIGGSEYDTARAFDLSNDGGYMVSGFTQSEDGDVVDFHGSYDAWVVKLGGEITNLNHVDLDMMTVEPNPSQGTIYIDNGALTLPTQVQIFSVNGQLVSRNACATKYCQIELPIVSVGQYIWR